MVPSKNPFNPFQTLSVEIIKMLAKKEKILITTFLSLIAILSTYSLQSSSPQSDFLRLDFSEFDNYLESFSKKYEAEEYFKRFQVYMDNMGFIRVFNSQGQTWVLGQTEFTDLTISEFRSKFQAAAAASSEASQPLQQPQALNFPAGAERLEKTGYPVSVDWRTQGAVTPVANQGNCNSGWAFSAAGAVEAAWQIAGKGLVALSEQQLMDCSSRYGNDGCNGGTMDYAFNYVINSGLATDADYPYKAVKGTCNSAVVSVASIKSFTDVVPNSPSDLYTAVALQPVSVAVDADPYIWQNYKGGVISRNCGADLNHAALVVGYNSAGTPPYWILKNSFGASWGESGYIRLAVVNGDGICGVQKLPSYPNVSN